MSKLFVKRIIVIVCAIIFLLFTLSLLSYTWDNSRVKDGQKPIFIFHIDSMNDGGTNIYYGLGYQIIDWNTISDDGTHILSGIETHYLFGMINPLYEGPTIRLNEKERIKNESE